MKERSPPECVLVDFDGTLIDSIGNLYEAYRQLLDAYGVQGNRNEFNDLNGPSTAEIVRFLKSKHNLRQSQEEIHEKYMGLIKGNYSQSKSFKDSELFLSTLHDRGIKVVLVTSGRSQECLPLIEKLGWGKYLDGFIWGDHLKNSKPSPDIYLEACGQAAADKSKIIVVEDSINGVKAASSAGLRVLGLSIDSDADQLRRAGALMVFDDLSSALDFIIRPDRS